MATNNEQVFRIWMQKQTQKNKDKGYTNNTIEAYCGALATKAKNLQLSDSEHIQPNLFLYNDFQEFQSICDIIRTAPNYKEIDKKAGNGAFSAGIQRYLEFLHDKNRASIQEDNKAMGDNELKEYTDILRMKKNIILQGAPGTGKTYTTAALALGLIDENISYFNHDVIMEKYQEYVEKGQIAFVTFHQSMDYEDFVEGLKPQLVENSDGNTAGIAYRVEDGIFKRLCKQAIEDSALVSMQDNFESVWGKLVDELDEKDFIEIPLLSGKNTFRIELNEYGTGLATRTYEDDSFQKDRWISGKSKFFSKEQLYNVYRGLPGTPARGHDNYRKAIIRYCKENLGLVEYALPLNNTQSNTNPFILIIDEINRGNVSKIFGELITLLEADKRIGSMHPINVRLPYSKELFSVPPNIYLIGTMNTTDRSVGTIDYAVRRRFAFITLKSEKSAIEKFYDNVSSGTDAVLKNKALELFSLVKHFIEENKIEEDFDDLMPGHSYFMAKSDAELEQKFIYEVLPLLHEYHKDGLLKAIFDEMKINNQTHDNP
jgi:ATP/GTP-binding site motif protein A